MDDTEENFIAMVNRDISMGFNYQKSKTQQASECKTMDLLKKLNSWSKEMKESQRQLDNILTSYCGSIKKELYDLTEEVSDLQAQRSVITKERNEMILAVDKMNGEIDQLRAQLLTARALPEPEEDCQDPVMPKVERPDELEYDGEMEVQESHQISNKTPGKQSCEDSEVRASQHQNKFSFDGPDDLYDTSWEDFVHEDANDKEHGREEEVIYDYISPACDFEFSTNENLQLHLKNIHSSLELIESKESMNENEHSRTSEDLEIQNIEAPKSDKLQKRGDMHKTFKCEDCPYQTSHKGHFTTHLEGVHEKIKRYVCKDCGYATSLKGHLKRHIEGVHEKIRRHVCKECGYAASKKDNLKLHMITTHKIGDKKFPCRQCNHKFHSDGALRKHTKEVHMKIKNHVCEDYDYASLRKAMVKKHRESVHNMGDKMYKCVDCEYAAFQKVHLMKHRGTRHDIGEKKFLCKQCPFKSYSKGPLKTHIKNVHLKR